MVSHQNSVTGIGPEHLLGFFVGWPSPPSPETHLHLLRQSDEVVLAIVQESRNVVGFVTATTDRVLSAHIPFLEVLPARQKQGVGSELVRRMLERLNGIYRVDVLCDPHLQAFCARFDMKPAVGAMRRAYEWQAGPKAEDKGN